MNIELIAESAFTHEGDVNYLKKQVDLAASKSCNYIKFQVLLNLDSVYSPDAPIYEDLKTKLISVKEWHEILVYSKSKNLKVLILPIDYMALDFALNAKELVDAIEIHSICLNDIILLNKINKSATEKLIVLGIGGRKMADIRFVVDYLVSKNILLMFGFQSFPTEKSDNNLSKIESLKLEFKFPIGFADHTPWNEDDSELIFMALAMGVVVIEKHIILEAGSQRADNYSAKDAAGFTMIGKNIQQFISIMGDDNLDKLSGKELAYKNRERKMIAAVNINKGNKIELNDLVYKVTSLETDLEQRDFLKVIGKKATRNIALGELILSKMVE